MKKRSQVKLLKKQIFEYQHTNCLIVKHESSVFHVQDFGRKLEKNQIIIKPKRVYSLRDLSEHTTDFVNSPRLLCGSLKRAAEVERALWQTKNGLLLKE